MQEDSKFETQRVVWSHIHESMNEQGCANVTDAIRPGVIRVSEGGWYDPAEPGKPGSLDRYGDVNVLTVDMGTSKLAQGNCGHTAVGNVEKYTGAAPKTMVFLAPKAAE